MSLPSNRICSDGKDAGVELFEIVKKWGKLKGADKVVAYTRLPRTASLYGFETNKKIKKIEMEI